MPNYRTKPEYVDAIQFDGENWGAVQVLVGTHFIDPAGTYSVPNFDDAATWWPGAGEDVVAVLYVGGNVNALNATGWAPVGETDWILKDAVGNLSVQTDEQFNIKYEAYSA